VNADPALPREARADETLLAWQLAVARKADELVRTGAPVAKLPMYCWLLAEAEVLGTSVSLSGGASAGPTEVADRQPAGQTVPA
jgi:hypothetical protein